MNKEELEAFAAKEEKEAQQKLKQMVYSILNLDDVVLKNVVVGEIKDGVRNTLTIEYFKGNKQDGDI